MTPQEMRARTEAFAKAVQEFTGPLLERAATGDSARQLLRAADGIAANYRAAGRGRSHAEFTAKIGVVLEEADEAEGWLCRLQGRRGVDEAMRLRLLDESTQLVKIFSRSADTARRNRDSQRRNRKRRPPHDDAGPYEPKG